MSLGFIYDSVWFYVVCVLGFGVYCVYYLYNALKLLFDNEKARKQFKETHKEDEIQEVKDYTIWVVVELIGVIYCIFTAITLNKDIEQVNWFRLAFGVVAVILLGQIILNITKRRILIAPDGFAYEGDVTRYQSILSMNPKRHLIFTIVEVLCTNNKKYTMPTKCGTALHDAHKEYKDNKKKDKK